ncbi:ArsR family transcriptional regulator [Halococcus dombrowskii]|uniref:ArsR family transcriptional regulator n=1 Tax=Halococcus dombrowskii TaxID=179637 RepID=A0AAV3SEZ2_HALDO|nr:helix-turn-helix domain-containing protein [Halococcus dombrowskii]UOO94597.1 ArsR family transcriptional regulator [Halococcus dombrowskii]
MSTPDIQECVDCVAPADAFALIGNETRLSILEALWRAEEEPVRFSTLNEMVGMRDSAQFNYHLGKLTDQYVRKVEEGYELRTAGAKVVRAVLAGSFTEHPRVEPFVIADGCTRCGEPLVASYEEEMLALDCPDCGRAHGEYSFPPGGLNDRTNEEVLEAFDQRVRHLHCLAKDGVCPECSGRMTTTISDEGECCLGVGLRADHVCEQCDHSLCSAIGLSLLDRSPVVAFHRDHDVDLGATPYWKLDWCVSDDLTTVRSTDPWELELAIDLDDERLHATLDGDLSLVETRRSAI